MDRPRVRCPVCGKELEVRCADHPEPFTAYIPIVGLECYGPLTVPKEVLHEGTLDGFRVLHLYFPETGNEHLVILPKPDETLHPICKEQLEKLIKEMESYAEFCEECCRKLPCDLALVGGSELCPGCPCDEILEDVCEDEWEEEEGWEEEEDDYLDEEW